MQGLLVSHRSKVAAIIASNFNLNIVVAEKENLKKGIVDEFKYGGAKDIIQIKKTGKELKSALQKEIRRQQKFQAEVLTKMNAAKKAIGFEPSIECDNWRCKQYNLQDEMPTSYDTYNTREQLKKEFTSEEEIQKACQLMYNYNNNCYSYCDSVVQEKMLNTLVDNVDEKKTYPLNIELATMLGF